MRLRTPCSRMLPSVIGGPCGSLSLGVMAVAGRNEATGARGKPSPRRLLAKKAGRPFCRRSPYLDFPLSSKGTMSACVCVPSEPIPARVREPRKTMALPPKRPPAPSIRRRPRATETYRDPRLSTLPADNNVPIMFSWSWKPAETHSRQAGASPLVALGASVRA
jgi:hypothetical protein